MNASMPCLFPGNTQEVIDYGLMAIALLGRVGGAEVGRRHLRRRRTVVLDPDAPRIELPECYLKHTGARLVPPITPALEAEVNMRRMDAAREFAALPDRIRGYERIKERSVEVAKRAAEGKLAALEAAALAASAR